MEIDNDHIHVALYLLSEEVTVIRHLSTFILITFVACLIGACDPPPPSGKAIFRAAFLQVFHDGKPQPLAVSIAFPKCAHQTVFGTGKCRHLLCNVIVDGNNRNRERERVVCEDAEQELLPKLDRVRTKDGCNRVLAEYAIRLLKMHAIDLELTAMKAIRKSPRVWTICQNPYESATATRENSRRNFARCGPSSTHSVFQNTSPSSNGPVCFIP